MEALCFFRNTGLGAIQANGGCWVGWCLRICDFAGEHYTALDGFSEHGLTRLGMLIPAESLARQERITEPLESDEGMTPAFCFCESCAEFLDACVEVCR